MIFEHGFSSTSGLEFDSAQSCSWQCGQMVWNVVHGGNDREFKPHNDTMLLCTSHYLWKKCVASAALVSPKRV